MILGEDNAAIAFKKLYSCLCLFGAASFAMRSQVALIPLPLQMYLTQYKYDYPSASRDR